MFKTMAIPLSLATTMESLFDSCGISSHALPFDLQRVPPGGCTSVLIKMADGGWHYVPIPGYFEIGLFTSATSFAVYKAGDDASLLQLTAPIECRTQLQVEVKLLHKYMSIIYLLLYE